MKKIMVCVLFAALAAMGLFAQSEVNHASPWESLNPGLIMRGQVKMPGSPYVNVKTGKTVSDIAGFKVVFFVPVTYQDDKMLPGYKRILSDKDPAFQVQVQDAKKQVKLVDLQPVSITAFKDATSNKDYLRVIIIVPTNYVNLYFYFDAEFTPLVVGEDTAETRRLVGQVSYVQADFTQPVISSKGSSEAVTPATKKLVPSDSVVSTTPTAKGGLK